MPQESGIPDKDWLLVQEEGEAERRGWQGKGGYSRRQEGVCMRAHGLCWGINAMLRLLAGQRGSTHHSQPQFRSLRAVRIELQCLLDGFLSQQTKTQGRGGQGRRIGFGQPVITGRIRRSEVGQGLVTV